MQSTATHSSHTSDSAGVPAKPYSRGRSAVAVAALSLGCFSFVSTELMPVGVLPSMAAGLDVSLGEAGYLVTGFAFVVALTAALLTSLVGAINRKALMAGLLAVCCLGNLLTFLAPNYFVVLAGRVLVAAAIGVFWSTAVVTAVHLVSARNAVRATSVVFGGVSLAAVLGVPAGAILGGQEGWRAVFAALTVLSLLVFIAIAWSVPAVRISNASIRGAMSRVLGNGPLLAVFGTTALIVTGNFLAYTYIAPYLEQIARQTPAQISVMLLIYGAAGVVSNFAVGPFASRSPQGCLVVVTMMLAASLLAMNLVATSHASMVAILAIWGAAYGALPVLLQTSVFKGASVIDGGADAATSINVSVFNAGIGLGALIGGLIINGLGPQLIPQVSAGFVLAALIVVIATRNQQVRQH
ncbi:MFS transporter [Pseudomonas gingeri]|uniref:MFS transporter n=1 Tax=Pseudomonas gingeri TaxID=117681 RepID=A0A7Y7YCK9_9PSED|nr:MFS transporter [Pseudomonas gingeri]NWA02295.1 MFS transporter [Pseudomonas gingeri]NWA12532.1 MFS transporter [Pseudomonas gingeri]NWA57062.1 MFS transporter [Pseudomonas gingeri]NWA93405.1 MFS transporter [Pseudomonas gingeri]NWB02877.1 MFS transporter [Pseudomonas gingeri]